MTRIQLDSGGLAQAGGGVADISQQLSVQIGSMREVLGQLQSGWRSSTAAPAFARTMNQYLTEAQTLQRALTSHGESLLSSANVVGRTEDSIAIGGGR